MADIVYMAKQVWTDLLDAIRAKGGTSALMTAAQAKAAVQAIPTGTAPTGTKQISITANGTTTEDVTNYASAEIAVNVSGGGGGNGYALLASGEFTKETAASASMSIPVSYSGTPAFSCVVASSIIPDTNQSYAFIAIPENGLPFAQFLQNGKTGLVSAVNTSGALAANVMNASNTLTNDTITCSRLNNTYLIQPNTYNWFIYGEAAT